MALCPSSTPKPLPSNNHNLPTPSAHRHHNPTLPQAEGRRSPNLAHHQKAIKLTHLQLNPRPVLKLRMRLSHTNTHRKSSVATPTSRHLNHILNDPNRTHRCRLPACSKHTCKTRQMSTRHQTTPTSQPKNSNSNNKIRLRLSLNPRNPKAMLHYRHNSNNNIIRACPMASRHPRTSRHRHQAQRHYHSPDRTRFSTLRRRRRGRQVAIKR